MVGYNITHFVDVFTSDSDLYDQLIDRLKLPPERHYADSSEPTLPVQYGIFDTPRERIIPVLLQIGAGKPFTIIDTKTRLEIELIPN